MPNGYRPDNYNLPGLQPISSIVTNSPISKEFPITAGGSQHITVKITASGVTLAAGITAKLQTSVDGVWEDSKTAAITANGRYYIQLLAERTADQQYLPLLSLGRVVITTGAGDAITVSSVDVLQDN